MALKIKKLESKMRLIKDKTNKKIVNSFSKKQQQILEEIKLGKRKNIYDVEFTKEEYLYKDSNGITFLEHLLNNKIYINKKTIADSLEAAYIFCKTDESLYSFKLIEEDIFSNIDGVRFIDFVVKQNKITEDIIKPIKNNIEIIDILISNNKKFYLSYLNEELAKKIIVPDSSGVCFIEKYINNESVMEKLIPLIHDSNKLIEICKKHNKYELLKYSNSDVLISNVDQNYTLIEDLLNKKIEPVCLKKIPNNTNFISYLRSKNMYKYFENVEENILLYKIDDDKFLLEEMLEKIDVQMLSGSIYNQKVIEILYKHNKLQVMKKISDNLLKKTMGTIIDDETEKRSLLEYMMDNGYNPLKNSYSIYDVDIIKILYNRKEYKLLGEKLNEKNLVLQMDDGVCLIDKLLDNNVEISYTNFKSKELLDKFYDRSRFDLLAKAETRILFNLRTENQTYFDCILNNIKLKNIKFNLNRVSFYGWSVNDIANFYLKIAKHDMMEYINKLDKEDLLKEYNGKTLLDELLDLNSNLTLEKVLENSIKSNMEIAIILKSRGLNQKDINVPLENKNFVEDYLDNYNNSLGIGPLPYEAEELLKKLSDLFLKDGKSDSILISALVAGYRHSLFVNYDFYINELRNLVNVKEQNIDKFIYIKEENGAFFRPIDGTVHSDSKIVDTILHETGHALHSYLVDSKMPNNYEEVVKRARENPDTLKRVEEYAIKYREIRDRLLKLIEEKYETFFTNYYTTEKKQEINAFLQKSLLEKKEEFKDLGITDDVLDIILKENFTIEEYINHQKRIYIYENYVTMINCEFGAFSSIGDILDAIYEGELHSGLLKNEKGEKIPSTSGHGVAYYYDKPNKGFSEMVADFAAISKSPKSREMLILLKSIVGDELFDMLNNFYYNNIIILEEEKLEERKTL